MGNDLTEFAIYEPNPIGGPNARKAAAWRNVGAPPEGETFAATMSVRWLLKRGREQTLQQAWQGDRGTIAWHDVPIVVDKPGGQ
jgi:hypothetical protein